MDQLLYDLTLAVPVIDNYYHRLPILTLEVCQRALLRPYITFFYGRNIYVDFSKTPINLTEYYKHNK